jgi:hypothetical protein
MKKYMNVLSCLFGLHVKADGIHPRWSFRWTCAACGDVRPGWVATHRHYRS